MFKRALSIRYDRSRTIVRKRQEFPKGCRKLLWWNWGFLFLSKFTNFYYNFHHVLLIKRFTNWSKIKALFLLVLNCIYECIREKHDESSHIYEGICEGWKATFRRIWLGSCNSFNFSVDCIQRRNYLSCRLGLLVKLNFNQVCKKIFNFQTKCGGIHMGSWCYIFTSLIYVLLQKKLFCLKIWNFHWWVSFL